MYMCPIRVCDQYSQDMQYTVDRTDWDVWHIPRCVDLIFMAYNVHMYWHDRNAYGSHVHEQPGQEKQCINMMAQ